MPNIAIQAEPIELYKVLKLANLVSSGGEAKMLISEGLVQHNQLVETQKRKKVRFGDSVTLADTTLTIVPPSQTESE